LQYRLLSASDSHDSVLRETGEERLQYLRQDGFFQRGIESTEAQALCRWIVDRSDDDLMELLRFVIRNNRRSFIAYTATDPPTDRVYPWGRVVLPVLMLGGRLFDGRATDPMPSAALVWTDIDTDIVPFVFDRQPTALRMLVYNFRKRDATAGVRALQLPEGRYTLRTAVDADSNREPDAEPMRRTVTLRRFTPLPLTLPAQTVSWIGLTLQTPREKTLRPDLAVTLAREAGNGGPIVARVHNLGCAPATGITVRLLDEKGIELSRAAVPELPGLTGYSPQFSDLSLVIPERTAPGTCRIEVDPDDAVDEINESNNAYAVSQGVPPPVESAPASR